MSVQGQSRRATTFAMSGVAPIAAVMLQCHESVEKCQQRTPAVHTSSSKLLNQPGHLSWCASSILSGSDVANPLATDGRTVRRNTYRWTGPICIALPPTEH